MPLVFGDFELDDSARSLCLNGKPMAVQPLVLSLLSYVVRHAGRVVPKEELLDMLWPGVHVTEASLQRAVSLARTTLRAGGLDGALRNIPRLGYRFALDRPVLPDGEPVPGPTTSSVLDDARCAAAKREWAEASVRFAEADRSTRLGPADLDLWAYTLECRGWLKAAGPLYVRAVEAHRGAGTQSAAARSAVRASIVEFELSNVDAGRGWLAWGEELLGSEGPPDVEALLLWIKARYSAYDGDLETSVRLSGRAAELAEASGSASLRALVIAYEGFYRMTLGDVAAGRARQDQAAAAGLSSEVDALTGSYIYCSILWTCRTFADWSRAAQWAPGFELWCKVAYAEVTGSCRLHSADVLASVGRLADALCEIDVSIRLVLEEGTWVLGDAYRVRGDIHMMMGEIEAARADYQLAISLGWDAEPGLAQLRANAGDGRSALAALDRSLGQASWYGLQRRGWLLANKAQIAARFGFAEEARDALQALDALRDSSFIPAVRAMTTEARAEIEAAFGDNGRAIAELQRARQTWIGIRYDYHATRLQLRIADLMDLTGDSAGASLERGAALQAAQRIGGAGLVRSPLVSAA